MSGVTEAGSDGDRKSRDACLASAESDARLNGLPSFDAWRSTLERRFTVMPLWYWKDRKCREQYVHHVRRAIDWQERERGINATNRRFQFSLSRSLQGSSIHDRRDTPEQP